MGRKPKVSVVIPVYNTEAYLRECLDSIIGQSLREIEVICVNDGSTDSSLEILEQYAANDSRVIVIDKHNEGAGASRNIGLERAQGYGVIFFDSDDLLESNTLELMYNELINDESDIAICSCDMIDAFGTLIKEMTWAVKSYLVDNKTTYTPSDYPQNAIQITIPNPWNKLYRREFVFQESLQFQNTPNANDVFFVILSLMIANKVTLIQAPLIKYRSHSSSITHSKLKKFEPICIALQAVCDELKNRNIVNKFEFTISKFIVDSMIWQIGMLKKHNYEMQLVKQLLADFNRSTNVLTAKQLQLILSATELNCSPNLKSYEKVSLSAFLTAKKWPHKTKYFLFGFFSLYKVRRKENKSTHYLFGFIPILVTK
ncbi:MAG: glycosyltransferase [Rikenellaceae bacterium]